MYKELDDRIQRFKALVYDPLDLKEEIYERWQKLFTKWRFEAVKKKDIKERIIIIVEQWQWFWKKYKKKIQKKKEMEDNEKEKGRNESLSI